jgi:hypothetical protein
MGMVVVGCKEKSKIFGYGEVDIGMGFIMVRLS